MAALKASQNQLLAQRSACRASPVSRRAVVTRAAADRKLWAPDVVAPAYLDGSLAGDYGGLGA
jgi:light-harvesting complex I chlorophyll a/b binding protein 4